MGLLSRAAVLLVFFASGATALVYQVAWLRQLTVIFGGTSYAITTILATFMGGLALGSYFFGRRSDAFRNQLKSYAALELGIGLAALAVPYVLPTLIGPYTWLRQLDLSIGVLTLLRCLLAATVLLPPTILMGGTLPILVRFLYGHRPDVGSATGVLYFVNTAGAVVGCVLAGFFLIEHFGLIGTTRLAAAVNLALAALAYLLGVRVGDGGGGLAQPAASGSEVHAPAEAAPAAPAVTRAGALVALVCIGLSGFVALAYEVVWARAMLRYLYNSTYAFTAMLAAFLAGIALGSALFTWLPGRRKHALLIFAVIEIGVGIGFGISGLLYVDLPSVGRLLVASEISSFGQSVTTMFVQAAVILLPPAILLGATVPLAAEICTRGDARIARSVGRVYAVNTAGAIAGSVLVTFVLIPAFGMGGTLVALMLTNVAMGLALAVVSQDTMARRLAAFVTVAALLVATRGLFRPQIFQSTFAPANHELVYYREGATDTVGVVESDGQRIITYDDRRGTAATWSYPWNFLLGHLPALLHPGEPKRGLHICFGVGNSLSAMLAHESFERVDSVELSPHVVEAADFFWTNDEVMGNPKVRTIIDDGRNYVMTSRETYDVIEIEPPFTFTSGVINLYTREFYEHVYDRLAADGVFLQWVQTGQGTLDDERRIFRAFFEVFPHGTAWQQLSEEGPMLLIGTRQPLEIDYGLLAEKMQRPEIRRDMDLIGVSGPDEILSMFVFDPEGLAEFVAPVAAITDDRTVVDFTMPRFAGSGYGRGMGKQPILDRGRWYHDNRRPVAPLVTNLGDESPEELQARVDAVRRPGWDDVSPPIARDDWKRR